MKSFKFKLIILFIIMTVSGAVLSGLLVYRDYIKYIDDSVAEKLEIAAYAAEVALDYSKIHELLQPGAQESEYYQDGINKLSRLNARIGSEYIYCVLKDESGDFIFGFDSGSVDDPPEDDSFLGAVEDWDNLLVAWDSGELVIDQEYFSDEWGTFRSSCLPLIDEQGNVFAAIGVDIAASFIESLKLKTSIVLIMSILIAAALAALIAVMSAKKIVRPISITSEALADIAAGQGDLTRRLERISNDEIGTMADNYNGFVETMSDIIQRIINAEKDLNAGGLELSAGMGQTAVSLIQINTTILKIKEQLEIQTDRLKHFFTALGANGKSINGLNVSIDDQAASLEESSAAIEEMLSNIKSVTAVVGRSDDLFRELKTASDKGMSLIETVSSQTGSIAGQSESLQQANSVIAGIASQTNLLAMNAAIEAAHAGNAGKGFSVVSDEIRKLAEESSHQSKSIGASLKTVINSIENIVSSTSEAEKAFVKVINLVDALIPSSAQISGAMEEQNAGSSQILEALDSLKNITVDVQQRASEMMDNGVVLKGLMSEINNINSDISTSMNEIENGAGEISSAADLTTKIANRHRQSITVLSKQTSMFKI
ncbi:MAG: methyl-accepting chemotaxis protein [Spirochaetales bacterium]|nr:methyl-accepting chemotaxis protein [Spirochaetales bacterium]